MTLDVFFIKLGDLVSEIQVVAISNEIAAEVAEDPFLCVDGPFLLLLSAGLSGCFLLH